MEEPKLSSPPPAEQAGSISQKNDLARSRRETMSTSLQVERGDHQFCARVMPEWVRLRTMPTMIRSPIMVFLVLCCMAAAGCRCGGPSEKELPATQPHPASSQAIASVDACPPRPEWAGKLEVDVEVELLHARKQGEKVHGTGYRLRTDGRFETYDTISVEPDETGRMVFKPVEGVWKSRGNVRTEAIESLRKTIVEQEPNSLKGRWRTKGPLTSTTHLTTRRGSDVRELCYLGTEGPTPIQGLEKQIHDLMAHREE